MDPRVEDTSPDVEARVIEGYRRMTPAQRAERVWQLNRFARGLALADVRRRYPQADERELLLRVAARYLDPELMRQAVGWDQAEKG